MRGIYSQCALVAVVPHSDSVHGLEFGLRQYTAALVVVGGMVAAGTVFTARWECGDCRVVVVQETRLKQKGFDGLDTTLPRNATQVPLPSII